MYIYRARHRRTIVTDTRPHWEIRGGDVQNNARCIRFGEPGCAGMCPRHDADGYAEHMARHATDSITPTLSAAERYHSSNQFGR
jgi:hypothetical protein